MSEVQRASATAQNSTGVQHRCAQQGTGLCYLNTCTTIHTVHISIKMVQPLLVYTYTFKIFLVTFRNKILCYLFTVLLCRPKKKNTSWSSWLLVLKKDKKLFKKRRMRAYLNFFVQDGRQAFKFKMATNFNFSSKWPTAFYLYSQYIHSMYFVKPNCLCMLFSIAFSIQQNAKEHHAWFKSLKNTPMW